MPYAWRRIGTWLALLPAIELISKGISKVLKSVGVQSDVEW
jgi:hypothetical protein